jgi:Protein of unknown function (DUF3486)
MARRRGKIARLPKEIRDGINAQLQDGVVYREICGWLAEQGQPEITEGQLTSWYQGGYQDWLREESQLDEVAAEVEFAEELVKDMDVGAFQEASLQMASARFFQLSRGLDLEALQGVMAEKPEVYVRMLNSVVRLYRARFQMEKHKREWEEKHPPKTLLTPKEQQQRMKDILGMI